MKIANALVLLLLVSLCGCSRSGPQPPAPGSDRDAHGCIPSAGYSWCEKTRRCERPWELARQQSFDNAPQAFEEFCRMPEQGG